MRCPDCRSIRTRVTNSRTAESHRPNKDHTEIGKILKANDNSVVRRRDCAACGNRFHTVEIAVEDK